jgi:hypothetical protein
MLPTTWAVVQLSSRSAADHARLLMRDGDVARGREPTDAVMGRTASCGRMASVPAWVYRVDTPTKFAQASGYSNVGIICAGDIYVGDAGQ